MAAVLPLKLVMFGFCFVSVFVFFFLQTFKKKMVSMKSQSRGDCRLIVSDTLRQKILLRSCVWVFSMQEAGVAVGKDLISKHCLRETVKLSLQLGPDIFLKVEN